MAKEYPDEKYPGEFYSLHVKFYQDSKEDLLPQLGEETGVVFAEFHKPLSEKAFYKQLDEKKAKSPILYEGYIRELRAGYDTQNVINQIIRSDSEGGRNL